MESCLGRPKWFIGGDRPAEEEQTPPSFIRLEAEPMLHLRMSSSTSLSESDEGSRGKLVVLAAKDSGSAEVISPVGGKSPSSPPWATCDRRKLMR